MNRFVIFGGTGFVGKYLTPLLDNFTSLSSRDIDLAFSDAPLKINQLVRDDDVIVMLSAFTPDRGDQRDTTIKNILMAKHMVEGLEGKKIGHFVYVSTDAVYGKRYEFIAGDTPVCPDTLYGHSHAVREEYFRGAIPSDKLTIIRPCGIYGAGDPHNSYGINRFVRQANEEGEISLFGEGEEYRDGIHVGDVAKIIHMAGCQKISGTFNAVSGKSLTFKEVAELIGKPIKYLPRRQPVTHRHFDNTALWQKFFLPRAIDMGLREML